MPENWQPFSISVGGALVRPGEEIPELNSSGGRTDVSGKNAGLDGRRSTGKPDRRLLSLGEPRAAASLEILGGLLGGFGASPCGG